MNDSTLESPYVKVVTIQVTDLEVSKKFYTNTIGLKIMRISNDQIEFGAGGHVFLRIQKGASVKKQAGRAGLFHFAILVPSREELATALRHYIDCDAPIQGAADHIFSEAIYLQDPDGNGIEVYRDRPKHEWRVEEDGSLPLASDPLDVQELLKLTKKWNGLPDGTVMGHIHLHVNNIQQASYFYHDLLGFNVKIKVENQALFVASGDYHHHIGLNTWAGEGVPQSSPEAAGLLHFQLHAHSEEDVSEIAGRLYRADYSYEKGERGLAVRDPAGNVVLLTY
ncbi:VOC family protein [Halobacillus seohaensis]|uniref:VOC family protein n=1 Tax=Halobacillus seohaensis TaxID=447421 RepID=A0ABW2ERP6_9BACI